MRKYIIPLALAIIFAISCERTPAEVAVSGVSIDQTSVEMTVGEKKQMSATISPAEATDQTITWSSSNKSVATISTQGLVTAIAEGTTTIKARAGGKTSACIVTVRKEIIAVTSITLDKSSLALVKGESETLVATVNPSNATHTKVSWTSSNPGVATVDSEGKVNAIANGNATITAQVDDIKASCPVTVTTPVESITLNKTNLTLNKGESETLVATVVPTDATETTVTWGTSNPYMVSVDLNGKVTAVGGGSATITAKAGGKVASCIVTVIVPVESIELNRTTVTLGEGESVTLKATVNPKDATDKSVTWSSSEESIVTVDQNGKINAIKQGSATIVAKSGDKQATCAVTVIKKVESIALDQTSMSLLIGETSTLTVTVLPEDATDKTVTWSTFDSYVATVENGVVKAIGVGSTTITASVGNFSASCSILVLKDSADGVSARFHGGNFETVDEEVQPGGNLIFGVRNYSTETIHVVSVQLIDGKNGAATDTMSIDADLASGDSNKWTIPVGDTGIYGPRARFTYTFRGESYTCEAEIAPR